MKVTVNGSGMELAKGTSVGGLIEKLGLSDRRVAVERNRTILAREDYPLTILEDGDVVEILSFVGGG